MKKIYIDEINDKSNELINYSKNDIAMQIDVLKELPKNFIWKGKAKDTFVSNYNNKINEIITYNNNIRKIAEFLSIVSGNYDETNTRIDNSYEELINELKNIVENNNGL